MRFGTELGHPPGFKVRWLGGEGFEVFKDSEYVLANMGMFLRRVGQKDRTERREGEGKNKKRGKTR